MSHAISDITHAVANPAALIGSTLGLGVGGAGGLTGANLAGNAATGQSLGTNLGGAIGGDLAGLGIGAGAAGAMAGGDPFAGFTIDPATGDVVPISNGAAGVGAGGTVSGGLGGMGGLAGTGAQALSGLLGGGSGGNPFTNFLTGQGGGPSLPSMAPGLAALAYASRQTPIDTTQLQNTFNASAANAPAFIQAAQNPLLQTQQQGYGDLLQSQAQRGIRGSSFGDQDIGNYLNTTNQGIATAGTNAAEAALGLQGSLAGQISNLNALSQQMKNDLYGRAFSSIGQGLNPTPGMGYPVQGGGIGGARGGAPGAAGMLGNLGLGGIGSAFGNGLSSIGSGLGNLFGSPGSTFWGPAAGMPLGNSGLDSINFAGDLGLAGF